MERGLTVFVPVRNEQGLLEANAARLMGHLAGLGLPGWELIIGSNGSADNTEAMGRSLAAGHRALRFFALPWAGPGRAFARAVAMARFDKLVTMDMDLSTDLDFIDRAAVLLEQYQVVVGSKRQGRQERSPARVGGSAAYILAARLLLGLPYADYSIGAKGFRLELLRRCAGLIDSHTAYAGNIIFAAHRAGLPVIELPVHCRDLRPSRFNLGREALYRLAWLARMFLWGRLGLGAGAGYFADISVAPSQSGPGGASR